MCGRYRRKSDKQKIAEAFQVRTSLEDLDFAPVDDITPGTLQPVVLMIEDGNRDLRMMYWGFNFPKLFPDVSLSVLLVFEADGRTKAEILCPRCLSSQVSPME